MTRDGYLLLRFRAIYGELLAALRRRIRWVTRLGALLLVLLFLAHARFPETLPDLLGLDLAQVIIINLFLLLLERVFVVEEALEAELERRRQVWIHSQRKDAYAHLQGLVRERGSAVKKLDLLQFSGVTALPLIEEAAKACPGAHIRILLIRPNLADGYDEQGFHRTRIDHTIQSLKVLFEERPNLSLDVWYYDTPPAISGVLVDNFLVCAGWYHVFPLSPDGGRLSIRGHITPAITAADVFAEPLLSMVRAQFDAVYRAADHVLHLPPPPSAPGASVA